MSFTPDEIEQWHRDRRAVSDKIEADRLCDWEWSRRSSAVAVCIQCGNPFASGDGYISNEVEMCYQCLD